MDGFMKYNVTMFRFSSRILLLVVILLHPLCTSADVPAGNKFCKSLGLKGQLYANCTTLDMWSLNHEDYVIREVLPSTTSLVQKAESGDAGAQFALGLHYSLGMSPNHASAADWYLKSAKQGNLCAKHNIGMMHLHGQGVTQNSVEALRLLQESAEQGFARSGRALWKILFFGHGGVKRDYLGAMKWLRKAAVQSDHTSHQLYLELFRNRGYGALFWKQDVIDAFHAEATKGDGIAQYLLGIAVGYYGNREETLKWIRKAAEQGVIEAQHEMMSRLSGSDPSEAAERSKWVAEIKKQNDKDWAVRTRMYQEVCVGDGLKNAKTSALAVAVRDGNLASVKELVTARVDINADITGNPGSEESRGITPLLGALFNGHQEIAAHLIENGANVNAVAALGMGEDTYTPLSIAIVKGYDNIVARLLSKKANPNHCVHSAGGANGTPLILAAREGNLDVIKLLVASGADINAKGCQYGGYGVTALCAATHNTNYAQTLEFLLSAGGNPDARGEDGSTPLMCAVSNANIDSLSLLLKAEANINAIDNEGRTALTRVLWLERACLWQIELADFLLKHGADPNIRDKHGVSYKDMVVKNKLTYLYPYPNDADGIRCGKK